MTKPNPPALTLGDGPRLRTLVIVGVADPDAEAAILPIGLGRGSEVVILERLPGGPVVVRRGRQELALGAGLARRLLVEPKLP